MANWLAVTERGAGQPVLSIYTGGFSRSVLSAGFGATAGGDGVETQCQRNGAIQTDALTIYAVLWDGLYRSVDGGATFAILNAFVNPNPNTEDRLGHGGLHYVYNAATQEVYLGGYYKSSTNNLNGWRYRFSDGDFAEVVGPARAAAEEYQGAEILYGTAIHFTHGATTSVDFFAWDPVGLSWSNYGAVLAQTFPDNCYAVGPDGVLYAVATNITGNLTTLLAFTGFWSIKGALLASGSGTPSQQERRNVLFSDGVDLQFVGFNLVSGSGGWRQFTITAASGFDPTVAVEVTLTTVPSDLRTVTDGGSASANATKRAMVVQDTYTTPGTVRTFLAFSGDGSPGATWSVREYLGAGTFYGFVGSGGQVRDSLPTGALSGGGYFYTTGAPTARVLGVAPIVGGESIVFIASGGGTVDVQFRRAANQQAATGLATLTGAATGGGTRVGNQVQGVTADGVTVNTVPWDFFTDGLTDGQALTAIVAETV